MKTCDHEKSIADLLLLNPDGKVFGQVKGFTAFDINQVVPDVRTGTIDSWLYEVNWSEKNR